MGQRKSSISWKKTGAQCKGYQHFAPKLEPYGLCIHVLHTSPEGRYDVRWFFPPPLSLESALDPVFWGWKLQCKIYFTAITRYITLITMHIIACYVVHCDKSYSAMVYCKHCHTSLDTTACLTTLINMSISVVQVWLATGTNLLQFSFSTLTV